MATTIFASLTGVSLLRRVLASSLRQSMPNRVQKISSSIHMQPSHRIKKTDSSVIVKMGKLIRQQNEPVLSLSQGIVHWDPPRAAINAASESLKNGDRSINGYGPANGMTELCTALKEKLATENGIVKSDVMVTTGANQAFANVVVSMVDSADSVVLFRPYYFNHLMALQMTGGADTVIFGETDSHLVPDMNWLRQAFGKTTSSKSDKDQNKIKLVVIVNPGNPSGTLVPGTVLREAADLCAKNNAWLVVDNTYEYFTYNEASSTKKHECIEGDHVVNIFSFSKAYGLMGWRVGYLAYPPFLQSSMLKVHDTLTICNGQLNQHVALGALRGAGRSWCKERIDALSTNRKKMKDAITRALGSDAVIGHADAAIYIMVKLPCGKSHDESCAAYLVEQHRVAVLPASSCGYPGHIRVCYGNLNGPRFDEAVRRLEVGLKQWNDDQ